MEKVQFRRDRHAKTGGHRSAKQPFKRQLHITLAGAVGSSPGMRWEGGSASTSDVWSWRLKGVLCNSLSSLVGWCLSVSLAFKFTYV